MTVVTFLALQSIKKNVKKKIKSKKFIFASLILIVGYSMVVNSNLERRARELLEEREELRELITIDRGNGDCDIGSPVEDAPNLPTENTTTTLVASYPGSGKRFTWTIIKALTNYEVADDWNFSEKLNKNPLIVKTSFPHKEGTWSWGKQMDQVLLLIRNPRRAIPSYHTMRWELDYAKNWIESWRRIPDTYTERPTVEKWEIWRDMRFNREMDSWFYFYDFWMQAGFLYEYNYTHPKCVNMEIDCQPKSVVDFETLYTDTPTEDFFKIGSVLDASENVDIIANQARACVIRNVYNRTGHQELNMHQANRPFPDLPMEYKFTVPQFDRMFNRTIELRNKYLEEPLSLRPHADEFVNTLNGYLVENTPEFLQTVDLFLEEYVAEFLGDPNCETSVGTEFEVCDFMRNRQNHGIFTDGFFPDDFPYEDWLTERSILVRMYLNHGGDSWKTNTLWYGPEDHCLWEGILCSKIEEDNEYRVLDMSLPDNDLSGSFPPDLRDLQYMEMLNLTANSLVGMITNDLCTDSLHGKLHIYGDAKNCPNVFDISVGEYLTGCCDEILYDVDIYLNFFATSLWGDANCENLSGTESTVCIYMTSKTSHDIFVNGYPEDFPGIWEWLKERTILVRMYLNNGGAAWSTNTGWFGSTNHCTWSKIICNTSNQVTELALDENQLAGLFPTDLIYLTNLQRLSLSSNSMAGTIPDDVCTKSTSNNLYIDGDAANCPNDFDTSTGTYLPGCCDNILIDVDIYLTEFAAAVLGSANCEVLGGTESTVCDYMTTRDNHDIFINGYPMTFPGEIWEWLKERAILVRMYLNSSGSTWSNNDKWLGVTDQCSWAGVTCNESYEVTALGIPNNQLAGAFPPDLINLPYLTSLSLPSNSLVGTIPNDVCAKSTSNGLYIDGDAANCPNDFDTSSGIYLAGCCDKILYDVDIYLAEFAAAVLGDADCANFIGMESTVCTFMTNKENHDIFVNGYPEDFAGGVWDWLKERTVLVRMYLNNGGQNWISQANWLGYTNHCTWAGVNCSTDGFVTELTLQNNMLSGSFPPDLINLDGLTNLDLSANSLVGVIPNDVCYRSTSNILYIHGDVANCPVNMECCDLVHGVTVGPSASPSALHSISPTAQSQVQSQTASFCTNVTLLSHGGIGCLGCMKDTHSGTYYNCTENYTNTGALDDPVESHTECEQKCAEENGCNFFTVSTLYIDDLHVQNCALHLVDYCVPHYFYGYDTYQHSQYYNSSQHYNSSQYYPDENYRSYDETYSCSHT